MKSVLVTGASSGIGRATALRLDSAGWKVYAVRAAVVKIGAAGVPPDDVARAIEAALTDSRPKPRVTIGRDAKGQLLMSRVLPPRVFNRIVARVMKLPS